MPDSKIKLHTSKPKILIVDDEQSITESMSMVLGSAGYHVDVCNNGQCAIQMALNYDYDLIFLDVKMPKMDGLEVLEKLMEINNELIVIIITGHGTIETAIEATRMGAYDFLQKPLPDIVEIKLMVRNAIDLRRSREQLKRVRLQFEESNRIIGISERIEEVRELIKKFAPLNLNVFITGESGTGKEIIARRIHLDSARSEKPFVNINSANLTEEKFDLELFGSLTGSTLVKGQFDLAEGGTVFFDEVSTLSTEIQARLLNVIETNRFLRTGSSKETYVDIRFIFATNADPEAEVEAKTIREDFFHRINVLRINVPPLRDHVEDIPLLTEHFALQVSTESNSPRRSFSKDAIDMMLSFRWPGNVRELKNFVERLVITTDKNIIEADDIELPGTRHLREFSDLFNRNMSLNDFQNESERIFLLKMLNDYRYNISQTASALQIQRSHLYKLMAKYNIPTPSKKKES